MIRVLSFTTFYFILCMSCTSPVEFSSRRVGINPEILNQYVLVKKTFYVKNWWLWESQTYKNLDTKILIYNNEKSIDLTSEIESVINKECYGQTNGQLNNCVRLFEAFPIINDSWLLEFSNIIIYFNGLTEEIIRVPVNSANVVFCNGIDSFLYIDEKDEIPYVFDLKTFDKHSEESINKIINAINEFSRNSVVSDIIFSYDENYKVDYTLFCKNVDDYWNYTYIGKYQNGKLDVDKISIDTFFSKVQSNEERVYVIKGIDDVCLYENGQLISLNLKSDRFIYYNGTLYGSDFQYQNVVKISGRKNREGKAQKTRESSKSGGKSGGTGR